MIATHNSLSENIRNASASLLNKALSTAIDLQGQMKQAHWNLRGPGFIAVHKLFDDAAALAYEQSDALAERAGALGSEAIGTIQVAAKSTALPPYPLKLADAPAHIEAVCAALAAYSTQLRDASQACAQSGDISSADLFTRLLGAIDAQQWLIEGNSQAPRCIGNVAHGACR